MKTIYILPIALILLVQNSSAQLTMLRMWHQPTFNDQTGVRWYDSTSAIPKATGASKTWDFSALTMNTAPASTSSFMYPSTAPSSSMFPTATLAEKNGNDYTFYNTNDTTKFQAVGYYSATSVVNYSTDPMTVITWPTSYGTSFNDSYSGGISGIMSGTINGNLTTSASGNGTVILPGGASFSDALQLMTVQSATVTPAKSTLLNVSYIYYHATQKFPLLTVSYLRIKDSTGASVTSYSVLVNKLLAVGLREENTLQGYSMFPNPAHDNLHVSVSNNDNSECTMNIFNVTGQVVKQINLGCASSIDKEINISDVAPGIYIVKTTSATKSAVTRLLVN